MLKVKKSSEQSRDEGKIDGREGKGQERSAVVLIDSSVNRLEKQVSNQSFVTSETRHKQCTAPTV